TRGPARLDFLAGRRVEDLNTFYGARLVGGKEDDSVAYFGAPGFDASRDNAAVIPLADEFIDRLHGHPQRAVAFGRRFGELVQGLQERRALVPGHFRGAGG